MMLNQKDKQLREAFHVGDVSTASITHLFHAQWAIDLKTLCEKKLYNSCIRLLYSLPGQV